MKPRYLEFCGINSFSEPAVIDFSALLEYGLFGIFGDTGSGKSTILDCIGFALYGNASRSRAGSAADLINYRSDRAYVVFEFEIFHEGRRRVYRVEREIKLKNAVQSLRVYERGETDLALAEGVREGNALLESIIGLEQKDFEKCIALPQGEFAQFVKAPRSERLKLVSRLFDLEAYGEQLTRRANARSARLAEDVRVLKAKLEPYEDATEEREKALGETIARLGGEELSLRARLSSAREEEGRAAELLKKRREYDAVAARLSVLDAAEEEIALLERELGRVELAAAVTRAAAEKAEAEKALLFAQREADAAQERLGGAEQAQGKLREWEERARALDAETEELSARRALAEQAEKTAAHRRTIAARLERARAEYAEESKRFKDFSYEEERAALEEALETSPSPFALAGGKAALFRDEYALFADELGAIGTKYPETEGDVSPLVEKYRTLSKGERADLAALGERLEAREKARKEVQEKLIALEKRKGLYLAHCERLSQLQAEGLRLKEELGGDGQAPAEALSVRELGALLEERRRELASLNASRERVKEGYAAAVTAQAVAREKLRAAESGAEQARERFSSALARGGFRDAEEAEKLASLSSDAAGRVKRHREERAALTARKQALSGEDLGGGTEEALARAEELVRATEAKKEETARALALAEEEQKRCREALVRKRELKSELAAAVKEAELHERLKKLLEGNKFMEFAAEEYLQNVTANASARLLSLTSGKYFLRYEKGFLVGDNLNGGKTRGVHTLSGGETFLVSLSLALALSSEICARSLRPIEFFFLDEGFGTLDEHLVDTVMDSLEKLKSEHFSIGIISHVEELKHRIEKKLIVEKATDRHGSRIHI